MTKKFIYTTILTAFAAVGIGAQTTVPKPMVTPSPQAAPSPVGLAKILEEAEKQAANYQETFKDLLATETKTFNKFDKNGELKDQTKVESIFLVYQSAKDSKVSSELRNVVKVDGEPIPDSQARSEHFLAELEKASTVERELEKLQQEGWRYDRTLKIVGFTLYEAITLSSNLRPFFDFKLTGIEDYQGSEVYVVSYQQTRKSPDITVNEKGNKGSGVKADFDADIPGALKKNDIFLRGKLWIDKNTFQIRREERQLTVQTATPLVAIETTFEYAPSDFGILVPKKISLTENDLKRVSKSDEFTANKNIRVDFDYSKFRKTNVEIKIEDDK